MDNTIYKVSLEIPIEPDRKTVKEFERILGKSSNFDIAAIMKKIEAEDEYIFEGLEAADIMYKIEPPFPYEIKKFAKFEDILDRICVLNQGLDKEALRGDLELKRGRLQAKGEDI